MQAIGDRGPRRPGWVYAIAGFYVLSAIWMVASLYILLRGDLPMSDAQREYFASFTFVDYVLMILTATASLTGAVALFRMKKVAFPLFCTALAANLALALWQGARTNWFETIGTAGLFGTVLGYVCLFAVCRYAHHLAKAGTLQ